MFVPLKTPKNNWLTPTPVTSLSTTPESSPQNLQVRLFYIMLNDNGKEIGCGDSLAVVLKDIPKTQTPLTDTLKLLLSNHNKNINGMYNALYQSNLTLEKATITDRHAKVYLSGTLLQGGVCDSPRIKAQLENTISQFNTIDSYEIFINNKSLDSLLSGKGE